MNHQEKHHCIKMHRGGPLGQQSIPPNRGGISNVPSMLQNPGMICGTWTNQPLWLDLPPPSHPLPHLFNIIWHSNWGCCLPFGYCICLNLTAWKLQLWYENLLCNVAGSINCKFVLTRLQMTFWLKNKKQWQQVKHSAITEIEKKFFWSHKVKCFSSSAGIITLRQTVFRNLQWTYFLPL